MTHGDPFAGSSFAQPSSRKGHMRADLTLNACTSSGSGSNVKCGRVRYMVAIGGKAGSEQAVLLELP